MNKQINLPLNDKSNTDLCLMALTKGTFPIIMQMQAGEAGPWESRWMLCLDQSRPLFKACILKSPRERRTPVVDTLSLSIMSLQILFLHVLTDVSFTLSWSVTICNSWAFIQHTAQIMVPRRFLWYRWLVLFLYSKALSAKCFLAENMQDAQK